MAQCKAINDQQERKTTFYAIVTVIITTILAISVVVGTLSYIGKQDLQFELTTGESLN